MPSKSKATVLICHFKFAGKHEQRTISNDVDSHDYDTEGLLRFVNGFWLDKDLDLAFDNREKQRYWVPPHKIWTIEKQEVPFEENN